ncbi:PREDICTED: uncharacterized protein LOC108758881 isoform X2 [Trachymyrmex cornetzi]|uniref:uncharacterized protein LOC108758881 isoform X2 n=1 Tax=Trachymyrmex cornetzi TaxID=471704 RepID=UPI00084F1F0B|nr:PREDICTED: uncharacterized protein LOC108758881 isoform X2 [Trachymyrmex cornetzi]
MLEKLLSCLGNIHGQEETTADATDRYRPHKKRQTVSKRACGQPKNFASTGPGGDVVVSLSGLRGWRLRRKEFRRSSLQSSLKVHLPNATTENLVWKAKAHISVSLLPIHAVWKMCHTVNHSKCVTRENDLKGSRILSSLQVRSTSRRKLRRSSWRSIRQTLWMTNIREESKPLNKQVCEP